VLLARPKEGKRREWAGWVEKGERKKGIFPFNELMTRGLRGNSKRILRGNSRGV
jgi:hypothetical protein